MEKFKNIIVSLTFTLFICIIFIINIFTKDNEISISERRKLEQFPKFSLTSFTNGTFFKKFDAYTTDQFIKRDDFRMLKAMLELKIRNNYNNLYVYDDYIVEQLYPLDTESVNNMVLKINFIKDNYLTNNNVYFSVIPDKNYFIDNGNLKFDYDKMIDILKSTDINYINIFNDLNLNNYYFTDSHWREETLENVVNKFSKEMNFATGNYTIEDSSYFKGVYASRLPINVKEDKIKLLHNDIIDNAVVYDYETKEYIKIYNYSKLDSLDKYDVYLSGAKALLEIETNSSSDKELIVFRDSFGSSLIPLFTSGYKKIIVVDTRYMSSKILKDFIDFDNKDVLFIYSTSLVNNSYTLK